MGQSASWLVNSGTWALALTNSVTNPTGKAMETPRGAFRRLVRKLGKPVIRKATYAAMQIMGKQFVLGRTIEEALKESRDNRDKGYTHAYDMLGEAALTMKDAEYINNSTSTPSKPSPKKSSTTRMHPA